MHLPQVVVGMVTANYSPSQQALAHKLGAAFVIAKPFTREALLNKLKPYLYPALTTSSQPATPQHLAVPADNIKDLVSAAMNLAVTTSVRLSDAPPQDITGSTGIVASLIDTEGKPRALISMDWALCAHLNAVLVGEKTTQFEDSLRNKRTTPQMRENLREVTNILKGACQSHLGQVLEFEAIAFRGDGQLRRPYWRGLLSHASFTDAERHFITLRFTAVGSGTLSIYRLS